MKTVKQVSLLTGVSVRTLHYYHAIGLLKPTQVTDAGYRLYDDAALERLNKILVYRELGMPLDAIAGLLDAPEELRNQALAQQARQLQEKLKKLQNKVTLAKGIEISGGKYMDFEGFDPKKAEDYSAQAKLLYGKTDAYREYTQKAHSRTKDQENDLGSQVMERFAQLGAMRPCPADDPRAQAWAKELRAFFTEHYYTCTPQILKSLAESYACGGSMTENIDAVGGPGTGKFAKEVIDAYVKSL